MNSYLCLPMITDPNVRKRLSIRRDTANFLARRSTVLAEVKRRSSIGLQAHEAQRLRRRSTLAANQEGSDSD